MATPEHVAQLRAQKQSAWAAAKALKERAINEKRDLTASEEASWDRLNTEIDDANARLEDIRELADRQATVEPFAGIAAPLAPEKTGRSEIREMLRSGEHVRDFDIAGALQRQQFAITTGTSTQSVSDFADRVAAYLRTVSPWLALSTIVRRDQGHPLIVPTLTTDVTSYKPAEGSAITESTGTIGSVTATPVAYKALSYWSAEADQDADFDIEDALARSAARSIGLAFGSDATVAVLAGINNGGTASGTPFFNMADLVSADYSRAAPYRAKASWVASNGALQKIAKFTDTAGQFLWQPNRAAGTPAELMGHPIFEDPQLAAVGSASKSVLVGDFAAALVVKMTPLRVSISRDFLFSTDQVALKTVLRAGLAVQDPAAAAFLVSGNS